MKEELLIKYIKQAVQKEVEDEFDKKIKILLEDLNHRKNEIVTGVVLNVMKTVEFESARDMLTIRIKEIK